MVLEGAGIGMAPVISRRGLRQDAVSHGGVVNQVVF